MICLKEKYFPPQKANPFFPFSTQNSGKFFEMLKMVLDTIFTYNPPPPPPTK